MVFIFLKKNTKKNEGNKKNRVFFTPPHPHPHIPLDEYILGEKEGSKKKGGRAREKMCCDVAEKKKKNKTRQIKGHSHPRYPIYPPPFPPYP